VDHGAPLYYYVAWAVQHWFGRGTLSEVLFAVTTLSACAVGVFVLAARASGSVTLGAVAALCHVLLAPRLYNYPKILAYVLAIPALWAFADRQSPWRAAALALITVVAFLFRHDHGVFIAASFAVLLCALPQLSWGQRARHALAYAALVVLLLSPYLLFIQANGGLITYLRTAAAWAQRDRDRAEVEFPGLFENPDGVSTLAETASLVEKAVATVQDNSTAFLFYAELALPFVALVIWLAAQRAYRPSWPNAAPKVLVVAALAVLLNAGFLRSPLEARLADPSVPHAVLLAWLPVALVGLLFRRGEVRPTFRQHRSFWPVAVVLVAVSLGLFGVVASGVTDDLPRRLEKARLNRSVDEAQRWRDALWRRMRRGFPLAASAAERPDDLLTLALYLRECTQPTDRIFVQHYIPQVLALGERGFAGGHADLRPGFFTTDEMQRLTVSRLQAQPVPVALLGAGDDLGGFRQSFPLVVAYLDAHFVTAAERTFDGRFAIRLLVNRSAVEVRRFQPLDWPCFVAQKATR
jgi:hypothetical protein